jgi:DNA-binding transcriptional ArsR family regulator
LFYQLINRIIKYSMATDQLSATFAALADPTRRSILARLAQGEATVNELAEPFRITLPAISRHLKVLERAGLITRRRAAQSRPTSLRIDALDEAEAWMDSCRVTWEGRMDRLGAHLEKIQAPSGSRGNDRRAKS